METHANKLMRILLSGSVEIEDDETLKQLYSVIASLIRMERKANSENIDPWTKPKSYHCVITVYPGNDGFGQNLENTNGKSLEDFLIGVMKDYGFEDGEFIVRQASKGLDLNEE